MSQMEGMPALAAPGAGVFFTGPAIDPEATVATDAPCRKCGYNLRGLKQGWRCPECGSPVGLSIIGDLLRYSDPGWLRTLVQGLTFILWGIVVNFVISLVTSILSGVLSQLAMQLLALLAGALSLYGSWLLTEPDPSGLGEAQYATSRKLIRVTVLVGLGSSVLQILLAMLPLPRAVNLLGAAIVAAAGLVGIVGAFATFVYLEKLSLRIPDDKLANRAKVLRWGYGISLGALVVAGGAIAILMAAAGPTSGRSGIIALGCFAGIAGIAFLVFAIMCIFFYIRLRKAFQQQAVLAAESWNAATGAAAL